MRRVIFATLLVFLVSSASLVLARLAPGDFTVALLGDRARPEAIERTRAQYGLNRPIADQYRDWIAHAIRFDFGRSWLYDTPVATLVRERAANTAILAVTALAAATCIGLPLGIVTGSRRGSLVAHAIRAASLVLLSLPPLLTSLVLVVIAARTGWLPVGGMGSAPGDLLSHLIVPATALALPIAAMFERLQSQAMAEVVA